MNVALVGITGLVDDMVTRLLQDSGRPFHICARLPASDDLVGQFNDSGAHVVLCMVNDERMAAIWEGALDEHPPLAVVNLHDQERSARLRALRPVVVDVAQLDAAALIDLLFGVGSNTPGTLP